MLSPSSRIAIFYQAGKALQRLRPTPAAAAARRRQSWVRGPQAWELLATAQAGVNSPHFLLRVLREKLQSCPLLGRGCTRPRVIDCHACVGLDERTGASNLNLVALCYTMPDHHPRGVECLQGRFDD